MNEEVSDAWFYTVGGERIGPVSMVDLRLLADEGRLNPRLDLCWCAGMPDWVPAGQVDGLFEKTSGAVPDAGINDSQSLPRNPQTLDRLSEPELELKLLEARWPGVSRRVYLVSWIIMPLLFGGLLAVMAFFMLDLKEEKDLETLVLVSGVATLVLVVFLIHMSMQRFRNVGMSRWWILGNLIPLLNLWLGYRSVCCPAGYEYHRKIDRKGAVLAVLYWGSLLLSLAYSVFGTYQALQGAGDGIEFDFERLLELLEESREGRDANVAPPPEEP